jgi:ferredoxin
MHATIQKPLDEIVSFLKKGEKIFVVGCGNCAEKCRSGGLEQAEAMKARLENKGIKVTGFAATASGSSLCKLAAAKKLLNEEHKNETEAADSFLVLACGQGIHAVMDATNGGNVHPGCDTIFGGETVTDDYITEYCSLCGECIVEHTGGLCPLTLCAKGLLNGPCGGAKDGKCEVDKERDCGWQLIYQRLKDINRLDLMYGFRAPKNYSKWAKPRSLTLKGQKAEFKSLAGVYSP